jgi:hypothetical protein
MREPKPLRPLWPPLVKRDTRGKPRGRGQEAIDARRQSRIPLTHHEILALAEPFTRRGRNVDLAGSDRLARRILFKPTHHSNRPEGPARLTEWLLLENPGRRHFRLTRTLTDETGLTATLRIDGPDPGQLIEAVDAVDPGHQFPAFGGLRVAIDYRIETDRQTAGEAPPRSTLVLLRATTKLDGITATLDAQVGHGMPAEISLRTPPERSIAPPEDLFAVLGWAWRPLRPIENGWRAHLRIPSSEPARTPDVEAKLARTLEHLVETLRAPPERFHQRWQRARWHALLRRALGLLTVVGLLVLGPALLLVGAPEGSPLRLLSFGMPALLMLILLSRHEAPVMRLPPLPKALPADAWTPDPFDETSQSRS